jgi:hypothetical protein
MKITVTTTTEFLQELETLLSGCHNDQFDHELVSTVRAEMNRMIGQAQRQITQPDHSGVH